MRTRASDVVHVLTVGYMLPHLAHAHARSADKKAVGLLLALFVSCVLYFLFIIQSWIQIVFRW